MIMSNYGIFNPKPYDSEFGKKVLKIFEDIVRKKKTGVRRDPRLGEQDEKPNFEQLNRDAVKSLHILLEVQKTDNDFEVI
jgi:hypothetical protein